MKTRTKLQKELQSVEEVVIALRRVENRTAQARVLSAAMAIIEDACAARTATTAASGTGLRYVD